jgi:hypothetical protein
MFMETLKEAWIQHVVNVALHIKILSCPSSCIDFFLELFLL